jgi:two-component sensor histidine kinase
MSRCTLLLGVANPTIRIDLDVSGDGTGHPDRWVLAVENNGRPIPDSVDLESGDSLGLTLVRALTSQIDATIEFVRAPSPSITISIPVPAGGTI